MGKKFIKSVSEFISQIISKIEQLQIPNERIFWFRGEDSEEYNLVPNLFRKTTNNGVPYCSDVSGKEIYKIEQNIDVSFTRKATVFLSNKRIENTPWNRYFLKQHYGVKTRLLDWTENALFALFFAVNDYEKKDKKNGKVSILSPSKLNNYSVSKLSQIDKKFYNILTANGKIEEAGKLVNLNGELRIDEILRKYYRMDWTPDEKMYPIAIYPPHLDERMSAQQACFTLFGNMVKGLNCNDTREKFLDCVYIDAGSKYKILKELRLLGISNYSMYPDLDGLGRTINYDESEDLNRALENNDFKNILKMQSGQTL
jgi:hypothetical protein